MTASKLDAGKLVFCNMLFLQSQPNALEYLCQVVKEDVEKKIINVEPWEVLRGLLNVKGNDSIAMFFFNHALFESMPSDILFFAQ